MSANRLRRPFTSRRPSLVFLGVLLFVGVTGSLTWAAERVEQTKRAASDAPVSVTASAPKEVESGATFELQLTAKIDPGFHIYGFELDPELGLPTKITIGKSPAFAAAGAVIEPKPNSHFDEAMHGLMIEHEGKVVFKAPIRVTGGVGDVSIAASFAYMVCNSQYCHDPATLEFSLPVKIVPKKQSALDGKPVGSTKRVSDRQRAAANNPVGVVASAPAVVAPGATFDVEITATIDSGYHIYGFAIEEAMGTPTRISLVSGSGFELAGKVTEPTPKSHYDEIMQGVMIEHVGKPVFHVPVKAATAPPSGPLRLNFLYMVCNAEGCLPEETLTLTLPITVGVATTETNPSPSNGKIVARSETGGAEGKVFFEARVPRALRPGQAFDLELVMRVDPGWDVYGFHADPTAGGTALQLVTPSEFRPDGDPKEPKPAAAGSDKPTAYEGQVVFGIPLKAPEKRGHFPLAIRIRGQRCSAERCIPFSMEKPIELRLDVPVGVTGGAATPNGSDGGSKGRTDDETTNVAPIAPPGPGGPLSFTAKFDDDKLAPGSTVTLDFEGQVDDPQLVMAEIKSGEVDAARQSGLLGIIWLSIVGALIALITPCVYPMIPITISMFTKHAESGKSNVVALATIFCLGIIVTFAGIGMTLSYSLGERGATFFATNGYVNFLLGALFVWFAFSLFGYYDISLPGWLTRRATGGGSSGGVLSVILMGFIFSITTFTCVGPIVATLLALAVTGGQGLALVGMLAFGATFSLPFFFLALFPKALSRMPRSGGWLNTVKVTLGFVELAAAFKFFAVLPYYLQVNLLFRELVMLIWGVIFLLATANAIGWLRFPMDGPAKRTPMRLAFVAALLALSVYCFYGATGRPISAQLSSQLVDSFFNDPKGEAMVRKQEAGEDVELPLRTRTIQAIRNSAFWSSVLHADSAKLPWRVLSRDTDLVYAAELAKTQGSKKPILLNFTGHI